MGYPKSIGPWRKISNVNPRSYQKGYHQNTHKRPFLKRDTNSIRSKTRMSFCSYDFCSYNSTATSIFTRRMLKRLDTRGKNCSKSNNLWKDVYQQPRYSYYSYTWMLQGVWTQHLSIWMSIQSKAKSTKIDGDTNWLWHYIGVDNQHRQLDSKTRQDHVILRSSSWLQIDDIQNTRLLPQQNQQTNSWMEIETHIFCR